MAFESESIVVGLANETLRGQRAERTGLLLRTEQVCGRGWTPSRRAKSPRLGIAAIPGLASVTGLNGRAPIRREGRNHVHQTHRYSARCHETGGATRGSLSRHAGQAEGRRGVEAWREAHRSWAR